MDGSEVKFLYLSQEDMIEAGVLDMHKCVEVIDKAFKIMAKGDYLHGGPGREEHGLRIFFPETPRGPQMPVAGPDRRFQALVGYVGGEFNVCGEKWYGSNRTNLERGLPRSILVVMLNDPETGAPLALMEGNLISAMRTGAVPGVGAKYLARQDSEAIGVIGAGVINRPCLMSLAEVLKNIKAVKVFDLLRTQSEAFSIEMKAKLGLNVYPVDSLEEAVRNSDVISFATSGTESPFTETQWIKNGAYVALSAPADFEFGFYLTSRIVADNWKMHLGWRRDAEELPEERPAEYAAIHRLIAEGRISDEDIENLGPIALGTTPGRTNDEEKILLLTGGLPIEDITWGYTVYKEAIKKGIGQELTLWEKPFWA